MIYENEKIYWLTAIMKLASRNPNVKMTLFAAYIENGLCYEFFSEKIDSDAYDAIVDAINNDNEWREAVKAAGIVEEGVRKVIKASFRGWDLWYYLQDATETILFDPEMNDMIPLHDRIIAHGLYDLCKNDEIDEGNWEYCYGQLREQVWGE